MFWFPFSPCKFRAQPAAGKNTVRSVPRARRNGPRVCAGSERLFWHRRGLEGGLKGERVGKPGRGFQEEERHHDGKDNVPTAPERQSCYTKPTNTCVGPHQKAGKTSRTAVANALARGYRRDRQYTRASRFYEVGRIRNNASLQTLRLSRTVALGVPAPPPYTAQA